MSRDATRRGGRKRGRRGFTMFEALIALALTGLVLAMLGTVTARWLPSWNHGFGRLQRADLVGLAVQRIAADLASAEFVSLVRASQRASFDGAAEAVLLVRSALGPNAVEGLEIIKIEAEPDATGYALVRSRASFALVDGATVDAGALAFTDKVTLLRAPYRVSFAYADASLEWRELWRDMPVLPSAIRITIEDMRNTGTKLLRMIARPHVNVAAVCARATSPSGCVEELTRTGSVRAGSEAEEREP